MKVVGIILKIVAVLAAIGGIVFVVIKFGDKIVNWFKKLFGCCTCDGECECCAEDCFEEVTEEAVEAAEGAVEEATEAAEEAVAADEAPVAAEGDFEG